MISYSGKEAFLTVFRIFLQICERAIPVHSLLVNILLQDRISSDDSTKEDDRDTSL